MLVLFVAEEQQMTERQLSAEAPAPTTRSEWRRRLAYSAAAVAAIVLIAWIGAAVIPRWWAHRIGDQVSGSLAGGITLGLVYGFLFTLLPLVVLAWAARRRRSWKAWLVHAVVAVVLALPNLFTLGIVLGRGDAAHAGERTLDVEAPGFRGGTLVGAILAFLFLAGAKYLLVSRRRTRGELDRLRTEARSRSDEAPPSA